WDCGYCHNPHLRPAGGGEPGGWERLLDFLRRRRGLLDAVVFSGGEPTLQDALPDALDAVRALGFATGLHTSGAYPERLRAVLPRLDWVGMDVKAPFDDYARACGVPGAGAKARESARLLAAGGVEHEFRTTLHPNLHTADSLLRLAAELKGLGARRWVLQEFRALGCAREDYAGARPWLPDPALRERLAGAVESFAIRRA
ncbi:MAG: anaerobic ribonucleoside-triphosphate reductase activating protein, partial [Elusimicrobia bacterium]|nr:anaerobic ribonucleoside-triphosphate reductase activating protein [Elusimicrobiota bacterium]